MTSKEIPPFFADNANLRPLYDAVMGLDAAPPPGFSSFLDASVTLGLPFRFDAPGSRLIPYLLIREDFLRPFPLDNVKTAPLRRLPEPGLPDLSRIQVQQWTPSVAKPLAATDKKEATQPQPHSQSQGALGTTERRPSPALGKPSAASSSSSVAATAFSGHHRKRETGGEIPLGDRPAKAPRR